MINLKLLELVFEITRKCNLKCDGFCMRGVSQNIVLSKEIVDAVIKSSKYKIIYIHNLVLSGGEPTLEPEIIEYIVHVIIENKIKVNSIRIVTNGQLFSQRIINILNVFDNYMKQNDNSDKSYYTILFSVDQYHQPIPENVKYMYSLNGIDCDQSVAFANSEMHIIQSGLNSDKGKPFVFTCDAMRYFEFDNKIVTIDEFYICANGNITSNGMGAYEAMDRNNFGNIKNISLTDIIRDGEPFIMDFEQRDIYKMAIGFLFFIWYNCTFKYSYVNVNILLVNFFQRICYQIAGKGFSKVEIYKINMHGNAVTLAEIDQKFNLIRPNQRVNELFCMLIDAGIEEYEAKSLLIFSVENHIKNFSLIYNILDKYYLG